MLGAVFAIELLTITFWLDDAILIGRPGPAGFIGIWGSWILRAAVGFAVFFLTFSWLIYRPALQAEARDAVDSGIDWRFVAAHAVSILLFGVLSSFLYGPPSSRLISGLLAPAWLATGVSAIASGAFAFIPPNLWFRIARNTGYLWMITLVAVLVACVTGNSSRSLWPWAAKITFLITRVLVGPFIPNLVVDPVKMEIGSPRFLVEIAPECSGLEGVGLTLAFGVTWLTLFRKQCRFPQALILLPAGAALIFLLNSVRIAALILIGNAGAERIAAGGFHSQAGWIVFNLVALGFTVASSQVPWLSNTKRVDLAATPVENPTAAWLMPFVMILAAGMISRTLTGDFEWLYPMRFFAAAGTLMFFKPAYVKQKNAAFDWRFDWFGPVVGFIVFIVWIGPDWFVSRGDTMPLSLAAAAPVARNGWLAFRVLAAVVTVPIAEELAFRGFLYRRLISADFESVSLRRFSWFAFVVSSVLFGALHGSRWPVGIVAGALYALVLLRRGRIGDAVAAHATTNALIAVDVLAFHHWNLW